MGMPKAPVENPPKDEKAITWKCTEDQKRKIVAWYASGFTYTEILNRTKEEFGISLDRSMVYQYTVADKWQPLIKRIREATMNDVTSVAGSYKRVRLERHEKIYDKAISKNRYDLAMKATEAQRKEMEDANINVILNQFNILSDDELEFKKNEVMKRIQQLSNKGVIDVVSTTT